MDRFSALKAFTRVVEAGSFTRAADSLNMPNATLSKTIQQLEAHLGVSLLQRTTRRITVTPEGREYYEKARCLLEDLEEIDASFNTARNKPKGHLRIAIGGSTACDVLIPLLAVTLDTLDEKLTKTRRRILAALTIAWGVLFVALCRAIGAGAGDNTLLQWFDFVADRTDRLPVLGQGAWLLSSRGDAALASLESLNPFFLMLPGALRPVAVIMSALAAVIASQALISGAFTIVSEATRLNWMPHLQVRYPARTRGQLYIPTVNVVLCCSTLLVLLIFRNSEHIAAAYGLALTITMIMTSILVTVYLWHMRSRFAAVLFAIVFPMIMFMFFIASMAKFLHGGWFTMLLALAILTVMATWDEGTKLERAQRRHMSPEDCLPVLHRLHDDDTIPYYADNIVYLTSDTEMKRIDTDIFFSIFASHPKRAHAWWCVSVETWDERFTR